MINPVKAYKRLSQAVIRRVRGAKRAIAAKRSGDGGLPPEDPYSYVTAPKRPRLPHLSAAAVAELPEEQARLARVLACYNSSFPDHSHVAEY